MESLGGRIAASNATGGGAVITLEFQIASKPVPDHQVLTRAQSPPHCRFLLIDDDSEGLAALKEVLLMRGHEADTAESASQALEKIRAGRTYDVVLCDLALREMNGWQVARSAIAMNPDLNFYIVTAWGQEMEQHMLPDPAVRGVLSKPIDLKYLERIAALGAAHPVGAAPADTPR
jgi:CheY-like chemotaxis protein